MTAVTTEAAAYFQGAGRWMGVVRFVSQQNGFVFQEDIRQGIRNRRGLFYTTDGGASWHQQTLPGSVFDCQVFEGYLLCSSAPGLRLLRLRIQRFRLVID